MQGPIKTLNITRFDEYTIIGWDEQWTYKSTTENKRKPLPYVRRGCHLLAAMGPKKPTDVYDSNSALGKTGTGVYQSLVSQAQNRARSGFMDQARAEAQLVVNALEIYQTLATASKLIRLVRSPIKSLLEYLKTRVKRRKGESKSAYYERLFKTPLRDVAGAYLEFHFGVEPFIKDIYAVLEAIDNVAYYTQPKLVRSVGTAQNSGQSVVAGNPREDATWSIHIRAHVGGKVQVTNRNRYLLNQLGFTNPAAVVWELVPFSFLLDWFIPIGAWIESLSDLGGLSLTDGYVSIKSTVLTNQYQGSGYSPGSPSRPRAKYKAEVFERSPTGEHLAGVKMTAYLPKLTSTKALVSASLLAVLGLRSS